MIRCFIGYDHRQIVSYSVLAQSIIEHASEPVAITPLVLPTLPLKRQGLTPFTYSRFLVPHLCDFRGRALFLDADIALFGDVVDLFKVAKDNPGHAVYVRKSPLKFEWASVMLFDCGHYANRVLTPEYIETAEKLHTIGWLKPEHIGDLPPEWNHLVGYDEPNPDAKLVHYTQGVPCHAETSGTEHQLGWMKIAEKVMSTATWWELMGTSVHAKPVVERLIKEGRLDPSQVGEKVVA